MNENQTIHLKLSKVIKHTYTHKTSPVIQTYNIVDYNRQKEKKKKRRRKDVALRQRNDDILSCGSYMVNNN